MSKSENEDEKIFKEEESMEVLKVFGLIKKYNYFKNVVEETLRQKFGLRNIDETRNYFVETINKN